MAEGKAVVLQSMSMHATEIGGSQMAPELIYDLASRRLAGPLFIKGTPRCRCSG